LPKKEKIFSRRDFFKITGVAGAGSIVASMGKIASAADFHKHFITFGGKDIKPDVAVKDIKMIEIMDTFDIMFSLNSYLVGVHEAPTKAQAEEVAKALAQTLGEMLGVK